MILRLGWGLYLLACIILLLNEFRRRRRGGAVMLDLGFPERRSDGGFLTKRATAIVLGVCWIALGIADNFIPRQRLSGLTYVLLGTFWLAASVRRRYQICVNGFLGRKLYKWSEIQEYYLTPKGALCLKMSNRGWTGFICRIPPEPRARVIGFFDARQIPAQQVTTGLQVSG